MYHATPPLPVHFTKKAKEFMMIDINNNRFHQAKRSPKVDSRAGEESPSGPNQPLEVPDQNQTPDAVPERM